MEHDPVAWPEHYNQPGKEECIDAMRAMFVNSIGFTDGAMMFVGFCLGNAFKYRWRAGNKKTASAMEDLAKAEWYERMAEGDDPRLDKEGRCSRS